MRRYFDHVLKHMIESDRLIKNESEMEKIIFRF